MIVLIPIFSDGFLHPSHKDNDLSLLYIRHWGDREGRIICLSHPDCGDKESIDDIKNDPTNREVVIVASSNLDIPNLEFGKPEIFTGKTVDVVTMYNIIRKDTGVKGRDDVTLEVEVDSIKDQIGNSSMINVLGNKFGYKRN